MGALALALGAMVLFNFVILRIKWNKGLYVDVVVDIIMLVMLNIVFGGSILGVISATAGSTLISLYLIWYPITLLSAKQKDDLKACFSDDDVESSSPNKKKTRTSMADRIDSLFN